MNDAFHGSIIFPFYACFTFQYGEIKSCIKRLNVRVALDLHSSMERLKAPARGYLLMHRLIFTFQYGEIKSLSAGDAEIYRSQFTFQYGEIKSIQNMPALW